MSNALLGLGTQIQKGDGANPETFTTIAEVGSITGPSQSNDFIDVTSMDSTAREFVAGLADPGDISFSTNYVPTNVTHRAVLTDFKDKSIDNYKLIFNDHATVASRSNWTFAAAVTTAEVTAPIDGVYQLAVTLKVTGSITEDYS